MYAIYDAEGTVVGVITAEGARYTTIIEVLEDADYTIKDIQTLEILPDVEEIYNN